MSDAMRAPWWARLLLWLMWRGIADRRQPDALIGGPMDTYLRRWFVLSRNRLANVYLHQFCRSDDDRALHDHPWWNVSILLHGQYLEHGPDKEPRLRRAGAVVAQRAVAIHRIELIDKQPCWTLFLTGPRVREWGFWCPQGWRHWREFTNPADGGSTVGKGCE